MNWGTKKYNEIMQIGEYVMLSHAISMHDEIRDAGLKTPRMHVLWVR